MSVPLPPALSFAEGAALPVAGVSALDCVRRLGEARSGQRALIIGATGGVGNFSVQLAKLLGLHVTAVCSEANAPLARELGADAVIAYDREDPLRARGGFDLVLDATPRYTFGQCAHLLTPRGIYVNTVPGPRMFFDAARTALFGGRRARFLIVQITAAAIAELAELAAARKIKVVISRTVSLQQVRAACEESMNGHVRGKIVAKIAD